MTKKSLLLLAAALVSAWTFNVRADDDAKPDSLGDVAEKSADLKKFDGDANDANALQKYAGEVFGEIAGKLNSDPEAAERQLDAFEKFLADQKIEDAAAKSIEERAQSAIRFFRSRLELARTSLEDLEKSLQEKPDSDSVQKYVAKAVQQISEVARTDPAAAEKQLNETKEFLAGIAEKTEDENLKRTIQRNDLQFGRLERSIASEKKLAELIGKEAAPLVENVEAWANGAPLTGDDLKGKVVLLDFWAVWCGPCIATFPHLREWNEKFSDDGLVIVGLTRYYNYAWDEDAGRAKRSSEEVTPADEQNMLAKFAEEHSLGHRFAIQKDRALSEYYAVSGIPHVVLIDREGKVRLIKVGSGEANAKAIGDMIEKLIAG